jgi:hypothetical protein
VTDVIVNSGTPIQALTVLNWSDTDATRDAVNAPSAAAITTKGRVGNSKLGITALAGDFQADLTLSDAAAKATLGTMKVVGDVDGRVWKIAGALTSLTVTRTVQDSWIRAIGSIGSLTIGSADGSDFLAGADFAVAHRPPTAGEFLSTVAPIAIKAIKVTGWTMPAKTPAPAFVSDTNFSGRAIGTVSLLNLDYTSGSAPWGVWALDAGTGKEITSVAAYDNVLKTRWSWPLKGAATIPAGNFQIDKV